MSDCIRGVIWDLGDEEYPYLPKTTGMFKSKERAIAWLNKTLPMLNDLDNPWRPTGLSLHEVVGGKWQTLPEYAYGYMCDEVINELPVQG